MEEEMEEEMEEDTTWKSFFLDTSEKRENK